MDTKKQHTSENYNLIINLLVFDRTTEGTESFYFHYMSTLQATTIIRQDRKIVSTEILAYAGDKYLDEQTKQRFQTIGDFNNFFSSNPDYYIHNCDIELENGLTIGSHDDGEVVIQFFSDSSDRLIIDEIFDKYNLDKKLIEILKDKPGHYIAIDTESNVLAVFESFDDYLNSGRD